jgi:demethoxyubiquinone hydroxylase (CLK1/Coq7/Cat5 family)
MAFVRQNVNLDREQLKLARRLANESGVAFSAYMRDALERHNASVTLTAALENSNAHLESLLDQLREENATLRRSLQEDQKRLRDEMKAEQDQAIKRYEDALRHVLTSMSTASAIPRSSPATRGAGLPVSKPNV